MIAIYVLASLPFFTGGTVISLAFARLADRINVLYASDLIGAALGCLLLIPLLNRLGAPGVVMTAATLSMIAALCFATPETRWRVLFAALIILAIPTAAQLAGRAPFAVVDTKGHLGDRVLFSKWNSFSRVAVYDRPHGDWSLESEFQRTAYRIVVHGHRLGGVHTHCEGHGSTIRCAVPSVRIDRARLSPRRAARWFLGAGHWPWRRPRPALGAGLRRESCGRRRNQSDHRERRHAGPLPRLLGRHLSGSTCGHSRGRWPELRPAQPEALRRDSGVTGRHVGRHGRWRVHADRELALHHRSVRRVHRPSHRPRPAHDHALGLRRPPPRVARAGGLRRARTRRLEAPGHRPLRSRRHVPAEEDAVHRGRGREAAAARARPRVHDPLRARHRAGSDRRRAGRRWLEPAPAPATTAA